MTDILIGIGILGWISLFIVLYFYIKEKKKSKVLKEKQNNRS